MERVESRVKTNSTRAKEIETQLRGDPRVVGLWRKMTVEDGVATTRIFHQRENQGNQAEEIIIGPEGKEETVKGKIVYQRRNAGWPTRVTFFKPQDGSREIELTEAEF